MLSARAWQFRPSGKPAESESLGEEDNQMHPGMFFWHGHRGAACGGHGEWQNAHFGGGGGGGDDFGGSFGVRRPLRFLAYKLDLDEAQVSELAAILSELKTERAQAEVDHRRTTTAFADAIAAESFDEAKARSVSDERVKTTERVQAAVLRALGRIHALLKPEQRAKLAYLLRTGALSM
jgi:Spy/CpxP family protein refolding chaperone